MRVSATYLGAILAVAGAFLAFPGAVQASEPGFSSIIESELDAIVRESELLAEELAFSESVLLVKPRRIQNSEISEIPADFPTVSDYPARWSELVAYDELRDDRLMIAALAERSIPARVSPLPPLPDSPAAFAGNGNSSVGLIVASAHFESCSQFSMRLKPDCSGEIQSARDAAVNVACRDYYSNRNGYHGRTKFAQNQFPPRYIPLTASPLFFHTAFRSRLRATILHSDSGKIDQSILITSAFRRTKEAGVLYLLHLTGNTYDPFNTNS